MLVLLSQVLRLVLLEAAFYQIVFRMGLHLWVAWRLISAASEASGVAVGGALR